MLDVSNRKLELEVGMGSYCESPSLAVGPDDNIWMAWISNEVPRDNYGYPERYRNYVVARSRNNWPSAVHVVSDGGVCYWPAIVADSEGAAWVFWSTCDGKNWNVRARRCAGKNWGDVIPITEGEGIDYRCAAAADSSGRIWVAWESHRNGKFDIYVKCLSPGSASEPVLVSENEFDNYRPSVAVDRSGGVWVAWDCCVGGRYDVFARRHREGKFGQVFHLSGRGDFNGLVNLAADPMNDHVWAVWHRWHDNKEHILTRCFDGEDWKTPPQVDDFLAGVVAEGNLDPKVIVDRQGAAWFFWALHKHSRQCELFARSYNGGAWGEVVRLTEPAPALHYSLVHTQDRDMSVALDSSGHIWMLWVSWLPLVSRAGIHLRRFEDLPRANERKPLALIPSPLEEIERVEIVSPPKKRFTVRTGGEEFKLYWGDLHGHTRLSYDGRGEVDEWFMRGRYRCGLDFLALADHDRTLLEHFLARTVVRVANDPPHFAAINAYEVVFALPAMGDKVVLEFEENAPYYWTCLHIGEPFVPREKFYEIIEKGKTLIISHDGAWTPGICDSDGHFEKVMPVVQVSTTHTRDHFAEFERYVPGKSNRGPAYERWQDALAKGFKYGAVGGSDSHNRAPQVRTGLFLRELTQEEIYEALRARRCFAVTPCRIAMDFRVNDCFMGSIVRGETEANRLVMAKVSAPSPIATVAIVKNNVDVFSHRSGKEHDWIEWPDPSAPAPGEYYYLRVTLENGHMAWSSPVWFE